MSFSKSLQSPHCERAQALLMELALAIPVEDDLFSKDDAHFLGQHMPECSACLAYQQQISQLTGPLGELETAVPEGLEAHIFAALDRVEFEKPAETATDEEPAISVLRQPRKMRHPVWSALAVAASFLVLALGVPNWLHHEQATSRLASEPTSYSQTTDVQNTLDTTEVAMIPPGESLTGEADNSDLANDPVSNLVGF